MHESCAASRGCSKSLGHKKTLAVILLHCFQRELLRFVGTPEKGPAKILNVASSPARQGEASQQFAVQRKDIQHIAKTDPDSQGGAIILG